jgi:Kelch motif
MRRSVALLLVLVLSMTPIAALVNPVFAATPNTWVTKASMNQARSDLGVVALNGKIYVIGGNTESGNTPNSEGNDYKAKGWIMATNEEYDPTTDKWTFKTPMPTPRYRFAIAAHQNKIYCLGGITNWVSGKITYTGVNEVYDPSTDKWENKTAMPTAASAQAHVIEGIIYLIGGGTNETLNQAYDPATDTWSMKASIPSALGNNPPPNELTTMVSTAVNNQIYAMSFSVNLWQNWLYDPKADSWQPIESSPSRLLEDGLDEGWWSQNAAATTGIWAQRRVYVFFGRYTTSTVLPNLAFNPSIEAWVAAANAPSYRQNFGMAILNDTLYAVGGRVYDYPFPLDDMHFTVTELTLNEQYVPIGYGTPQTTPSPEPTPIPTPTPEAEPKQEPFPTIPALITIVAVIFVAGAEFLLYRKRYRSKSE